MRSIKSLCNIIFDSKNYLILTGQYTSRLHMDDLLTDPIKNNVSKKNPIHELRGRFKNKITLLRVRFI